GSPKVLRGRSPTGPAGFFYVAGYPLLFAGIILLPHLRPGHFERIRLAIDALAGTVSLGVLVNLITNAVRYGRSKITVVTRIDNGANVFHDDGDGVPNKYQHTIFERFERGAHKFDSAVGGSGIGLSVGRDLVTAHGGEIRYRPSDLLGGACLSSRFRPPSPASRIWSASRSRAARYPPHQSLRAPAYTGR
ncbi:MAG: sensor histidine kinase, partial [Acidimicrobiia bacterium]